MLNKNDYIMLSDIASQEAWHCVFRDKALMAEAKRSYRTFFRDLHYVRYVGLKNRIRDNMRDRRVSRWGTRGFMEQRAQNATIGEVIRHHLKNPQDAQALCDAYPYRRYLSGKSKPLNELWRNWSKVASNEWKPVVWKDEAWVDENPLARLHCVHVSEEDPTMVAYTQSVDKLMRDIQTRMKPGKYLKKYYPEMSDEDIRMRSHRHDADQKEMELEFIKNDEPEAWVEAYSHPVQASDSSATSCMCGCRSVKVYAHPKNDLTLIVVRKAEMVIARAIANFEEKQYVRSYTNRDHLSSNTFEEMLAKDGWEHDSSCLNGQKLVLDQDESSIVCPYIDGNYQYVEVSSGCLVISSDGISASNTSGYVTHGCQCNHCDEYFDEDEVNYYDCYEGALCRSCANDLACSARTGRRNGRWQYAEIFRAEAVMVGDEWYDPYYAEECGIGQCDESGEWYDRDELVYLASGELVYQGLYNVVALDVESKWECAMFAWKADTVTLENGDVVYEDDAVELPWGEYAHEDDVAQAWEEMWDVTLEDATEWLEESNYAWVDALETMFAELEEELEGQFESVKRDWRLWPALVEKILRKKEEARAVAAFSELQRLVKACEGSEPVVVSPMLKELAEAAVVEFGAEQEEDELLIVSN